ncbi:MAG: hypothetical protein FIB07_13430 [Candidatus Methanoperedens sp.]|nr:hypothetical protein [Candidatus Methanoperedens sp.]
MNNLARLFIKTSLVYLALSTILGVLITIGPGYSFMHSHFALIGWVSFMLFGLAYESIPRYTSRALYSRKLGMIQFWLLKEKDASDAAIAVMIFGLVEAISYFIFIYNIWKSMGSSSN